MTTVALAYAAQVADSLTPDADSTKDIVVGYEGAALWREAGAMIGRLNYALAGAKASGGNVDLAVAKLQTALTEYRAYLATALTNTLDPLDSSQITDRDAVASSLASTLAALTSFSTTVPTFESMRDA